MHQFLSLFKNRGFRLMAGGLTALIGLSGWLAIAQTEPPLPWQQYWQNGLPFLAIETLQQSLTLSPSQSQRRVLLGQYLYSTGQSQAANDQWRQVITQAPGSDAAQQARTLLIRPQAIAFISPAQSRQWTTQSGAVPLVTGDKVANLSVGGPDYLSAVLFQGQRVRWALTGQPLKIYVEPIGTVGGSAVNGTDVVLKAVQPWLKALDGQLSVTQVMAEQQADITVHYIKTVDRQGVATNRGTLYTAGTTQPQVKNQQLSRMDMQLALTEVTGQPHTPTTLYNVALHEFGHALGLLGHSPNSGDVMHGETSYGNKTAKSTRPKLLSAADTATIRRLYSEPAQITQLPPAQPSGKTNTAEQLETEIAKREQEATLRGTRLNWSNLAQLYLERARQPKQDTQQTLGWILKAHEAATSAVKADPASADAYFSRSVIDQLLKQNEDALKDINRAVALAPGNGRYYLEQGWIYARLNRRAEGLNALDRYRLLPGGSTSDPYYVKVRTALGK